jgi:crossover junction endodeoxyribonuclease RuvC
LTETTRRLVLGVDPGLSGALALVEWKQGAKPKLVELLDMPVRKNERTSKQKNEVDAYALGVWLLTYAKETAFAVVEDVGVLTGAEGRVSMFNFGRSAGIVAGALGVLGVPIFLPKPAVWKLAMGLGREKKGSLELARRIFPDASEHFSRAKDDGRAEASLLGLFGAERYGSLAWNRPKSS